MEKNLKTVPQKNILKKSPTKELKVRVGKPNLKCGKGIYFISKQNVNIYFTS